MKKKSNLEKMTKLQGQSDELISFNHELYDEFTIQELEERLETKPWICGAYVEPVCPQLECGINNPEQPSVD